MRNGLTFALVFMGPLLAAMTFLALGPLALGAQSNSLRLILLADLVYILLVAGLVLARVMRMISDRRSHSAGSRLHLRLSVVFAIVALFPTILVAVFAVLSLNIGLEGWFSDRVREVVGSSLQAAEAYDQDQRQSLSEDAQSVGSFLDQAQSQGQFQGGDGSIRPVLAQAQGAIQRGLKQVYLIDGSAEIRIRGERSYLFDYSRPTPLEMVSAREKGLLIIPDLARSEFRALVHLKAFPDRYLLISREVDGRLLSLLDQTKQTVALYQQLEAERGSVLFNFALIYLGFALLLILAAIWAGLWFAERLARPVGRLAVAAELVGQGDLSVQVPDEEGDDEIATLGRAFNQMTRQLTHQRTELMESHRETEERRRLFDSVLASVTAGVIGLDDEGRIDFVNRAAVRLLDLDGDLTNQGLVRHVPEFAGLLDRQAQNPAQSVQEEIRLNRRGRLESLLVRVAGRVDAMGQAEGTVVAFDDVTQLVSAQRMAAWGDVARRIAHEIKNPLTPIQLSAERIKRKFRDQVRDPDDLAQYADVIVRQTNDLRRIVDEFSKFARMPEPDRRETDLRALVAGAVMLQENGQPGVRFVRDLPQGAVIMVLDATMIGQALTNLIKNAGEAIETLVEKGAPAGHVPEIRIALEVAPDALIIQISDNGIGLPADREKLFEPYVTTREKGTGLGLSIVKKIIEEHGGTLRLEDAVAFGENAHRGAMAVIRLPRDCQGQIDRGKASGQGGR